MTHSLSLTLLQKESKKYKQSGSHTWLIASENTNNSPQCRIEGGDVMLNNEYVFVGYSEESDLTTIKLLELMQCFRLFRTSFSSKKSNGF